ncbi:MAG: septum formation initiator family protein [Chitinophagia bacterium]|nr:septum formation initiator family protein [Chitinophagia bacterium]
MTMKPPAWLRNRYTLTLVCFVVWMLFFDRDDVLTQWSRQRQLDDLNRSRDYYRRQIVDARNELDSITVDPAAIERIARERYLMKRDGEELFVITRDP